MIHTPTWRANINRIKKAGYRESDDINGDCFRFVSEIRKEYGEYSKQIFIGGLIGCKGDAYKPDESLSTREAVSFHRWQVKKLFEAGVDFFIVETLPAADEALGIAMAKAKYDIPYILSFILKPTGTLLDGSPLHEVISMIDKDVKPHPYFYMANCIHPSIFEAAMAKEYAKSMTIIDRVKGLQANTSLKSPGELEGLPYLDIEEPEIFARSMTTLYKRFGTKVLGGCCGTDNRHIECIARQIRGIYNEKDKR